MIISPCPRCDDCFRISKTNFEDNTLVECPWCREQFPIDEVLEKLPPELVVVTPLHAGTNESGSSIAGFQGINFDNLNEQGDLDPSDTNLADPNHLDRQNSSTEETTFDVGTAWSNSDTMTQPPLDFPTTREKTKKRSSGFGTFVGIILGGFASLPLAGLILLALGKSPDLGFWPFDTHRGEPSRKSAAPLPSSETRQGVRGTQLRFNQPTNSNRTNNPTQDALDAILNESVGSKEDNLNQSTSAGEDDPPRDDRFNSDDEDSAVSSDAPKTKDKTPTQVSNEQ